MNETRKALETSHRAAHSIHWDLLELGFASLVDWNAINYWAGREDALAAALKVIDRVCPEDIQENVGDEPDDSMDGDHQSALASAGLGVDEDYGYFGDGEEFYEAE